MRTRLNRMLTHMFCDHRRVRRAFPSATLQAIEDAVATGERSHRAEIRFVVECSLNLLQIWRRVTPRERAKALFGMLGAWDTEDNNGVLIYVQLADRAAEIVADRTVARDVPQAEWDGILTAMMKDYGRGEYRDATCAAIAQISRILAAHYPPDASGRINQLPDRPIVL